MRFPVISVHVSKRRCKKVAVTIKFAPYQQAAVLPVFLLTASPPGLVGQIFGAAFYLHAAILLTSVRKPGKLPVDLCVCSFVSHSAPMFLLWNLGRVDSDYFRSCSSWMGISQPGFVSFLSFIFHNVHFLVEVGASCHWLFPSIFQLSGNVPHSLCFCSPTSYSATSFLFWKWCGWSVNFFIDLSSYPEICHLTYVPIP